MQEISDYRLSMNHSHESNLNHRLRKFVNNT